MANNLPIDIIVDEILPKLPAKSLLRFKGVSKSFKTLISSPNFIHRHLRHSLSSVNNRFLLVNARDSRVFYFYDLNSPEIPPSPLPLPSVFKLYYGYCDLASCNGLLLFKNIVINPFTRTYSRHKSYGALGFGYDPITNDYKLVKNDYDIHGLVIYSLTNKSSHLIANNDDEIVDNVLIVNVFRSRRFAVVVNQCLCHWLYWYPLRNKSRHLIICLDLRTEKLTADVPLPPHDNYSLKSCDDKREDDVLNLSVFEGYLSVLIRDTTDHGSLNVWVMKEHGVAESWVKLFSVPAGWSAPLCYSPMSTTKVLIRKGKDGRHLMWYDVTNKQSEKAELQADHRVRCPYDFCLFTGSLVTVPGEQQISQGNFIDASISDDWS